MRLCVVLHQNFNMSSVFVNSFRYGLESTFPIKSDALLILTIYGQTQFHSQRFCFLHQLLPNAFTLSIRSNEHRR
ncbi:hypothetical protein SAMN06295888_101289 [Desulfonatronum zhilinae]|nr:hypothetical protein SAMN06295888_101289 [Desulfonatronum zhilinae]